MVGKTGDQIKNRRRFRRSEAEQGSGAYVAPLRVNEAHRRRWKRTRWVGVSPPLPRVIARHADRAGSDNEGIVFHGAVGRSENGGGSKRV